MDYNPWGSCPWDFLGTNTGTGCHFLLLSVPRIKPASPALAGKFFTAKSTGKPKFGPQFSCSVVSDSWIRVPMNRSTPGLRVHHQLLEFTQTHVHQVSDAIQPSHPRSSPSPPAHNPSQHQGLFQWVNSSHDVAKVLEFQPQHHSFQWTPRTDLL